MTALPIDVKSLKAVILLISIFCFQACSAPSTKEQSRLESKKSVIISVQTFKIDSIHGYGYEILIDGKTYIHQEFIPAVEGKRTFTRREDALKVGRFVMKRIKNKQSPALSKEEVIKLLDMKE